MSCARRKGGGSGTRAASEGEQEASWRRRASAYEGPRGWGGAGEGGEEEEGGGCAARLLKVRLDGEVDRGVLLEEVPGGEEVGMGAGVARTLGADWRRPGAGARLGVEVPPRGGSGSE